MKKAKGFTLIELIIVMAILSILMVGILQMMKPIRSTFVDSTYYESQRNTQNGIITYLSENLRFATNIGIYTSGTVDGAISDFKTNVVNNKFTDNEIYVITIDNNTAYSYENTSGFHGRLIINKPKASGYSTSNADKPSTNSARVALSEAYYGAYTYSISLAPAASGNTFDITVSSLLDHGEYGKTRQKNAATDTDDITDSSNIFVSTKGYVVCKNMDIKRDDSGNYKAPASVVTTTQGTKTYIVYTIPES